MKLCGFGVKLGGFGVKLCGERVAGVQALGHKRCLERLDVVTGADSCAGGLPRSIWEDPAHRNLPRLPKKSANLLY
jgi:hypothetical protein